MSPARITDQAAREAVAAFTDLDNAYCPDGFTESEIDLLIEEVDRELAAEAHTATVRVSRTFTDARRAHRAERRAGREALRSLPIRMEIAELDGEVAA